MDVAAFETALRDVAEAARASLSRFQTVTGVVAGGAQTRGVASNRRVPAPDGTIRVRWSACTDAALRGEPEGLIDPRMISVAFWGEREKLGVLHYYATHPMSYYGDGRVTADFMGRARQRRFEEDDGVPHLVFTGCAGNITAGKYNDGSPENRPILASRVHDAMVRSEQNGRPVDLSGVDWRTLTTDLCPRATPDDDALETLLADRSRSTGERIWAAMEIVWRRYSERHPATLSCLRLGDSVRLIHLPGEPFVEYQLYAQSRLPDGIVAVAGYGDGGIGYIPLERSFEEGGYEPDCAFAEPASEWRLKETLDKLLA